MATWVLFLACWTSSVWLRMMRLKLQQCTCIYALMCYDGNFNNRLTFPAYISYQVQEDQAVFLYCFPDCPSCVAHLNSISQTTWAVSTAIKKCDLRVLNTLFLYFVAGIPGNQCLGVKLVNVTGKKKTIISGDHLPLSAKSTLVWLG